MKAISTTIILIFISVQSFYCQELFSVLNSVIDDCRNGRKIEKYNEFNVLMNKNPYDVALSVRNFAIDSSANVRKFIVNTLGRTGMMCESIYLRQNICEILTEATNDPSKMVRDEAFSKLKHFKKTDFNDKSRKSIFKSFRNRTCINPLSVKIAGFISPEGIDTILRNIVNEYLYVDERIVWAARVALARTGKKEAEYYCMSFVEKLAVNDTLVEKYIPDLVYSKSRKNFEYIIILIQSDNINCNAPNPGYPEKILCAYRLMELLAPAIIDFPVKTTSEGYLATTDFQAALALTRKWLEENRGTFRIDDSVF